MPYSLSIQKLKFSWPSNPNFKLNIANWQVKTGQKVFLYGRSGEGKTSLLNLISGIEQHYSGSIEVLGQNLAKLSQIQRDAFRANNIGVIFQQFNLLGYLTARDNILLAQQFKRPKSSVDAHHLEQICDTLSLSQAVLEQKACHLSVGQQQRVAVARALLSAPALIIADEPTSALDTETRQNFIQLLLQSAKESSVIFVSHDMALAEHFDEKVSLAELQCDNAHAKETPSSC